MRTKETINSMREIAFKLDQLGYDARKNRVGYKAKEYFECATLLRNSANKLEYVLA
jgi:hypothetical protein